MSEKTELQQIRESFGASRTQFGKIFLGGISKSQMYFYEHRRSKIPEKVMALARQWKTILDFMDTRCEK